jgi:hypothetical protein
MLAIRHDGYTIRDLSFQFSLMILGIKQYVETKNIWSKKRHLYRNYFGEFEMNLRPVLLNLAINFRAMDDELKADSETLKTLSSNYIHHTMAFSVPDGLELNLRDVCNKIIHSRKSYWYEKDAPHVEQIKTLLSTDDEHHLMIIEGDLHEKSWTIGINLITLAEQFYEYAEVACEYCGA